MAAVVRAQVAVSPPFAHTLHHSKPPAIPTSPFTPNTPPLYAAVMVPACAGLWCNLIPCVGLLPLHAIVTHRSYPCPSPCLQVRTTDKIYYSLFPHLLLILINFLLKKLITDMPISKLGEKGDLQNSQGSCWTAEHEISHNFYTNFYGLWIGLFILRILGSLGILSWQKESLGDGTDMS